MSFIETRNALENALIEAGCVEVIKSKNTVPSNYPVGIISVKKRIGQHPIGDTYSSFEYLFEIYLILTENDETTDTEAEIIKFIEGVEEIFSLKFYKAFSEVLVYDSMASSTPVKVAQIEVII